jgi:hypothetical protein
LNHFATPSFWSSYRGLPADMQALADKCFALLKTNPRHPSLHLKKAGRFWSVRVGKRHRALAREHSDGLLWFWIGSHDVYQEFLKDS